MTNPTEANIPQANADELVGMEDKVVDFIRYHRARDSMKRQNRDTSNLDMEILTKYNMTPEALEKLGDMQGEEIFNWFEQIPAFKGLFKKDDFTDPTVDLEKMMGIAYVREGGIYSMANETKLAESYKTLKTEGWKAAGVTA